MFSNTGPNADSALSGRDGNYIGKRVANHKMKSATKLLIHQHGGLLSE